VLLDVERLPHASELDTLNSEQLSGRLKPYGALALLEPSRRANEVIGTGDPAWFAEILATPTANLGYEDAEAIRRALRHGPGRMRVDIQNTISGPVQVPNIVAEIRGASKAEQWVLLGAHFDSWDLATGAQDNGAGTAQVMEAARVLAAEKRRAARSVRFVLFGGEEEGLLGSKAYVKEHFGDPETMKLTEAHAKLDAYFNVDNGSGKIRGMYLQGNDMCRPIFEQWFAPFKDMDAGAITIRDTGGTDHLSFDAVGLPGFQFIQDELEYTTRTHHSNMDVYDHASPSDLKQAATIVASFVYLTANRPEMMPRKPLPPPKPVPKPAPEEPAKGKPAA